MAWSDAVGEAKSIAPFIAKIYKIFYDEFKSAGFTDAQALTLVRDCVLEVFSGTEQEGDEWKNGE